MLLGAGLGPVPSLRAAFWLGPALVRSFFVSAAASGTGHSFLWCSFRPLATKEIRNDC